MHFWIRSKWRNNFRDHDVRNTPWKWVIYCSWHIHASLHLACNHLTSLGYYHLERCQAWVPITRPPPDSTPSSRGSAESLLASADTTGSPTTVASEPPAGPLGDTLVDPPSVSEQNSPTLSGSIQSQLLVSPSDSHLKEAYHAVTCGSQNFAGYEIYNIFSCAVYIHLSPIIDIYWCSHLSSSMRFNYMIDSFNCMYILELLAGSVYSAFFFEHPAGVWDIWWWARASLRCTNTKRSHWNVGEAGFDTFRHISYAIWFLIESSWLNLLNYIGHIPLFVVYVFGWLGLHR